MDDEIPPGIGSHSEQGYFQVQVVPSVNLEVVDPVRSLITGLPGNPSFFLLVECRDKSRSHGFLWIRSSLPALMALHIFAEKSPSAAWNRKSLVSWAILEISEFAASVSEAVSLTC